VGVLTFNVQAFEAAPAARVGAWLAGPDGALDGVDVVCVQEDAFVAGGDWIPGFRRVAQHLQTHGPEGSKGSEGRVRLGNGIYVREGVPARALPSVVTRRHRSAPRCAVAVELDGGTRVVCTHFCGGRFDDPHFRRLQAEKVAELDLVWKRYARVDVLAADFNGPVDAYFDVGPDAQAWTAYVGDVHDRLRARGYVAAPNRAPTSARARTPVDWVYVDPRALAVKGAVRRFDAVAAGVSDHVAFGVTLVPVPGSNGGGGSPIAVPRTLALQTDANARMATKYARLRELSRPAWRRMGDAEKTALVRYQTSGYVLMNDVLRGEPADINTHALLFWLNPKGSWKWEGTWDVPAPPFGGRSCDVLRSPISAVPELVGRVAEEVVASIRTLDALFASPHAPRLPEDMVLYRGERGPFATTVHGAKPGAVVAYPNFLSTTLNPGVMADFMRSSASAAQCALVIRVPAGTPFVCLDGLSGGDEDMTWELEILFPRGAQMRVARAGRVPGLDVDVLSRHADAKMPLVHAELASFGAAALPTADAIAAGVHVVHVQMGEVKSKKC